MLVDLWPSVPFTLVTTSDVSGLAIVRALIGKREVDERRRTNALMPMPYLHFPSTPSNPKSSQVQDKTKATKPQSQGSRTRAYLVTSGLEHAGQSRWSTCRSPQEYQRGTYDLSRDTCWIQLETFVGSHPRYRQTVTCPRPRR
jgi:hypothetical protein